MVVRHAVVVAKPRTGVRERKKGSEGEKQNRNEEEGEGFAI